MGKKVYTEYDAENFLKKHIPVAKNELTTTVHQARKVAKRLGFPLVIKLLSPDALHKTDIKGVRLIKNMQDLEHEYLELIGIAVKKKLDLQGILVQQYIKGEYLLLGLKKDPVFGHVLAFGTGGIYTELLKDVSFRVCPITKKDAYEMVEELKMKKMLKGFRGKDPVNMPKLIEVMVRLSKLPKTYPDILELDINPFVVNKKGGFVVDARMVTK
jgi:succinyl-CoA synthetase beta subunit